LGFCSRSDYLEENLKNPSPGIIRFAVAFIATGSALFAGGGLIAVTPEPSLVALTAAGVAAIILVARKKRGR